MGNYEKMSADYHTAKKVIRFAERSIRTLDRRQLLILLAKIERTIDEKFAIDKS